MLPGKASSTLQSLAEQLLPIGSYGQEPILNVCKLGRLQNDAAKSRLGHGFLQIGWWVGPSGNRAVFLRKFMKQSNLYFLLRCGSNTPWVDSALQSSFTSSQVLEEMERVILCPGLMIVAGGEFFWKTLKILHFELTAQIPLTTSVCLVTEYYSESWGGVENTKQKCFDRYDDAVSYPFGKWQMSGPGVRCSM